MSLRLRIFLFNLMTVAGAFALVMFVGFKMLSSTIEKSTYDKLRMVRVEKTRTIENYFRDVITASDLIATNSTTLGILRSVKDFQQSKAPLSLHQIDEYARSFNLLDLILVRTDGSIAYATDNKIKKKASVRSLQSGEENGQAGGKGKVADLYDWGLAASQGSFLLLDFDYDEPTHTQALGYLATPVFQSTNGQTKRLGVLIFRITIKQIDQITSDNYSWAEHGLGATGETLIYGEDWSLRNTSRFAIESDLASEEIAVTPANQISEFAAKPSSKTAAATFFSTNRGDEDLSRLEELDSVDEWGRDYRGEKVYRSIGKLFLPNGDHWFIQVKIDDAEAFAVYRRLVIAALIAGFVTLGLFFLLSNWASRKIMRPIGLLIENLEKLGTSNLSQQVDYQSADEIGTLVTKYNQLAQRLANTTVSRDFVDSVLMSLKEYLFVVRVEKNPADIAHIPFQIMQANISALQALGLSEIEILYQDLHKMICLPNGLHANNWLFQLQRGLAADLMSSDGRKIPVLINWSLLPEQESGYWIFVFACTDITESRANEKALIAAREQAVNASLAKSEFLARMSHEIRTPLNAMIGMGEVLLETSLDSEQRHLLGVSMNAGENLLSIINDILDLSKIEARQVALEKIEFDVVLLVENVCQIFSQKAKDKNLCLQCKIQIDSSRVMGDPTRIRQVLLNLVGNAIKFTSGGEIVIAVTPCPLGLCFAISDTGLGIPESKRDLIFKNFSQADSSTTRKFGGSGLGLAICKNLVELMGGEISFDSVAGQGSTFRFSIPLPIANTIAIPQVVPLQKPVVLGILPPRLKLLIVDDTDDNRLLMRAFLKKQNCDITEATNGKEALELFKLQKFDVIFMDAQMPVMDGNEATERIRNLEKARGACRTLIIATSANALKEEVERSYQSGCDDYLAKPIKKTQLFQMLEKHFIDDTPCANA